MWKKRQYIIKSHINICKILNHPFMASIPQSVVTAMWHFESVFTTLSFVGWVSRCQYYWCWSNLQSIFQHQLSAVGPVRLAGLLRGVAPRLLFLPLRLCLSGRRTRTSRQTPGAINSFTQCRGVLQAALRRCRRWVTGTVAERRAARGDSASRHQIGGRAPPQWSLLRKWKAIKDPTFPRSTGAHV